MKVLLPVYPKISLSRGSAIAHGPALSIREVDLIDCSPNFTKLHNRLLIETLDRTGSWSETMIQSLT